MPVEQEPQLNEEVKPIGRGNRMPNGETLKPRELGRAGIRLLLDQMLNSFEGIGVEQMESLGISLRDLAAHREEVEAVLVSIIENEGHRPQRQKARTAALRICGHLEVRRALPALRVVVSSAFEPPSIRAAALDGLRQMRAAEDLPLLEATLAEEFHPTVARAAARALGQMGHRQHLELLKRRYTSAESTGLRQSIQTALNQIEEREGLAQSRLEKAPPKRERPQVTQELHLEIGPDGHVVERDA